VVVGGAAARARGEAAEMHRSKLSGVLHKGFKPDKWSVQIVLLSADFRFFCFFPGLLWMRN
jgi:hypothetical protein